MQNDTELLRRAQVLLTLDYSLGQVREILLHEGFPEKDVHELIDTTEKSIKNVAPPKINEDKIVVDIKREMFDDDFDSPDLVIDRYSGRVQMLTPHLQETWRVANEIRKNIRQPGFF
ncbi:MAG: hypothetical protein FWG14_02340 [Peptococcaceae bacterium]|nr:hypothetical protein [Peptococcaceae bacterium]